MTVRSTHVVLACTLLITALGCQHRHSRHNQAAASGPIRTAAQGGDQVPAQAQDDYSQLKTRVEGLETELRTADTVPASSTAADSTDGATPTAGTDAAGTVPADASPASTDAAGASDAPAPGAGTDTAGTIAPTDPATEATPPAADTAEPAAPTEPAPDAAGNADATPAEAPTAPEDPEARRRRVEEETRRIREVLDQMNGKSGK